jgi:hypothetical protein
MSKTEKPTILTDVYGTRPPKANEFGKGISDRAGAKKRRMRGAMQSRVITARA